MLRNQVLKFCGITPVNVTHLGGRWTDPEQRQRWLVAARDLGCKDAAMRRSRPARQSTTVSQDEEPVLTLEAQQVVRG